MAEIYSIAGLVAIFAAGGILIVIMGAILGVGKLVAVVWLHRYWKESPWWRMRLPLSLMVIVLMFITSMGVFGFLSKAHIEQTSASQESVAQVERYNSEIKRQTALIERYETRIRQLESGGGGADASIQSQIDSEQRRIDAAYARIQPQIDEQNRIIEGQSRLFSDQITRIDSDLAQLQKYIDEKQVDKAQAMVGVKADGDWGSGTARAVNTWKANKTTERTQLVNKIQDINRDNSNIQAAREEVKRLRATVDGQVAESNKTIVRLRESLGKNKSEDIDSQLKEQMGLLKESQTALDTATSEKYKIESEYRKLEAEVGPVKYIAEFIYGEEADKTMLERAVRWVIITIIFVFDPLAVMLLLASQHSFELHRRERKSLDELIAATPPVDNTEQETQKELYVEIIGLKGEISDLTEKLKISEEVKNSYIKAHDDEEQDNTALHAKIDQLNYFIKELEDGRTEVFETNVKLKTEYTDLEAELYKTIAERDRVFKENVDLRIDLTDFEDALAAMTYERDRLFKAHGDEMQRADELAVELQELAEALLEEEQSRTEDELAMSIVPPQDVELRPFTPQEVAALDAADAPSPVKHVGIDVNSIVTEGVTEPIFLDSAADGYVKYQGKLMSLGAIKQKRPDLIEKIDDLANTVDFGTSFPKNARVGDLYIRIETLPHTLFKFNNSKWIVVDKLQNASYLHCTPYIEHLIEKLNSGEYDADMITDYERDEIERQLSSK